MRLIFIYFVLIWVFACAKEPTVNSSSSWKALTREEARVIEDGGTEMAFSGQYDKHFEEGVYTCKRCGHALYGSHSKFNSGCGWPAFDSELWGSIKRLADPDGHRTEIRCARCDGHLGHVFLGEGLTPTNTRHCVNSVSMDFVPAAQLDTAVFAAGCFWGVQYLLDAAPGVIYTVVGYTGGHKDRPTYEEVSDHGTGHLEAVQVIYDKSKTNFEALAKLFFEIHDPTQHNGQGPDIGEQYLSAIFSSDSADIVSALELIRKLKTDGLDIATQIRPAAHFWPAEAYHQNYYLNKGTKPYCHKRTKRF